MNIDYDEIGRRAYVAAIGFVGSVLSIISAPPRIRPESGLTWKGMATAMICGVVVATVATSEIVEWLDLSPKMTAPIAAAFGIGGQGLVAWIARLSHDPLAALRELRGVPPQKGPRP